MRKWAAVTAVLGCVFAAALPAGAQEDGQASGVLLIMDASGSMARVDDRGVRLIDGAKEALDSLVDALPEGAPIGLRVYGHRVPNTDPVNGCTDTELVVPVGPLGRDRMHAAIGSFDATGFTPIGRSLEAAAADLGGSGTVVLVSDGEDTCAPPDPCEVAADLLAAGFDLRVETVGFFLDDDAARSQLQCISDATGGSFREVGDLDVLAAEMGLIIGESIPGVGRLHLPLAGGTAPDTATAVPLRPPYEEVTSDWLAYEGAYETVLTPNVTEWFVVELGEGIGLSVYGAHTDDAVTDGRLEIDLRGPDLTEVHGAGRGSGPSEFPLADIGAVVSGEPVLGASTFASFGPWDGLESFEHDVLAYRGLDRAAYERAWLAHMLAPLDPPTPAGSYYVGLTWWSDAGLGELPFGWGVGVTRRPIERYGQTYERLDGGPDRTSAVELPPPTDDTFFDPFHFPPGDYPAYRTYQVGAIGSGETRWYHQPLEFDEALEVEALAVDADGSAIEEGELTVRIVGPDGADVGRSVPPTPAFGPDGAILAAVSMAHDGVGPVPPSTDEGAWLAVSWTSPSGTVADLRMLVDVVSRYPGGSAPEPEPAAVVDEEPASEPDRREVDEPEESGGDALTFVLAGGVLAGLVLLAVLVVRRRRRAGHRSQRGHVRGADDQVAEPVRRP